MHLVGYFYENYHDARPPEHKVLHQQTIFIYSFISFAFYNKKRPFPTTGLILLRYHSSSEKYRVLKCWSCVLKPRF
jgi:hypothetical protein